MKKKFVNFLFKESFINKKEIQPILLGLGLIYFFYFSKIFFSNITLNEKFFLTYAYPTDPRYLNLIIDPFYFFLNKFQLSNLLVYLPDFFFLKLFGFNNLWFTILLYKTILYFILITSIKKIFLLRENDFLIWVFIVVLSICSSYELYADRLLRDQLTIIFYSLIFINLYLINRNNYKNVNFIILGSSTSILLSADPWSLLFLLPIYLINLKKIFKNINLFLIFFLIFLLPTIYIFFTQKFFGYNNVEYLGSKFIFHKLDFYVDYLFELSKSKRIIILLLFNLIINLLNKNNNQTLFLFALLTLPPVVLILLNFTIQSYHLLQGAFNVTLFYTYFFFLEFLTNNKLSFFNIRSSIKVIFIFLPIYIFLLIFINNSWIQRAENLTNLYKKDFNKIQRLNQNCVIISNDDYIRAYASILKKNKILPEEGFIRNNSFDDMVKEVNFLIYFLKIEDEKVITDFYFSASHALFYNTRSTNSKMVNYSIEEKNGKLQKINSMSGFVITVPNKYLDYKNIEEYINSNKLDYTQFNKNLENFIYLDNNKVYSASSSCSFY
jgi:hypothetical protein